MAQRLGCCGAGREPVLFSASKPCASLSLSLSLSLCLVSWRVGCSPLRYVSYATPRRLSLLISGAAICARDMATVRENERGGVGWTAELLRSCHLFARGVAIVTAVGTLGGCGGDGDGQRKAG